MHEKITALSKNAQYGISKQNENSVRLLVGLGVEGDVHAGETVKHRYLVAKDPTRPNRRQVHLIHSELHQELKEMGFSVSAGQMGENITTQGIDLLALPQRTRLLLGATAVVEITGLRTPCSTLNEIQDGLMKALVGTDERGKPIFKAGIMGIVLEGGTVYVGDEIRVQLPEPPYLPLDNL